jgi:hypothetical protein
MRLLIAALLAAAPAVADAQHLTPVAHRDQWALGFTIGAPTSLSVKKYFGTNAFDAYVGVWSPGLRVGADYPFNLGRPVAARQVDMDVYIGVGGFGGALEGPCGVRYVGTCGSGDGFIGARMPVGAELLFKEAPFTAGIEVAPGLAGGNFGVGFIFDFLLAFRVLL